MHIFTRLRTQILQVITHIAHQEDWLIDHRLYDRISVDPPRDINHGNITTNAAMVLSKSLAMAPIIIAEKIVAGLRSSPIAIHVVTVANPGFINIILENGYWQKHLAEICNLNINFGRLKQEKPRIINVEYVSTNPTGPLHIGHTRGAVFGDVLARLLQHAGHEVTKEYYVNDAGAQIDNLARSLLWRYHELCHITDTSISVDTTMPKDCYPGEYLIPLAQELYEKYEDTLLEMKDDECHQLCKKFALNAMLNIIKDDLAALGIQHDIFVHEQDIIDRGLVHDMCKNFQQDGLVYRGQLDPPKGKIPDDWEAREQLLFRSRDYGDDTDRPLQKSDGSWTYFASDMAYHYDKYQRGYYEMINIFGADHAGYVKRLVASVDAFSQKQASLDIKICQLVRFMDNGESVKMSKRAGSFVTMRDLIDRVGADSVRLMMLTRKNDAQMDFDFAKTLEQSRDNPVFYLQYAHARCCSLEKLANEQFPNFGNFNQQWHKADLSLLDSDDELRLIVSLGDWPRQVDIAAENYEPHRIVYYLLDLAAEFHSLWTVGSSDPTMRFIIADDLDITRARMALIYAVQSVLVNGFDIIGITPLREL